MQYSSEPAVAPAVPIGPHDPMLFQWESVSCPCGSLSSNLLRIIPPPLNPNLPICVLETEARVRAFRPIIASVGSIADGKRGSAGGVQFEVLVHVGDSEGDGAVAV